jgi:ATP-dependent DNA helicase MPH1
VERNPGQQVKGRSRADEPPTHHHIDTEAAKTWIYPTNVSFREYQFNIVQRALFDNILVSLPTGLGKTFIAATVMFNYYRWFPRSKIVFVAPTKPLVSQQVEACFKICGVPYSKTAQLTGSVLKPQRATAYAERRVFYMTPQTLSNDLKSGLCDAKTIVCLVIDEAHRGTGNYAYGECVSLIRKKNPSLRILALSATPGASVDAVQNVVSALCIARVEIRIEESIDLRPYLHKRKMETITLPLGDEIISLRELYAKIIQKLLDRVKNLNDSRLRDPLTISLWGVKQAGDTWNKSPAGRAANPGYKGMIAGVLGVLTSLAHAMSLLTCHGIQPFYDKLLDMQNGTDQKGKKPSKARTELFNNPDFQELMTRLRVLVDNPNTVGHPKLDRAASMIIDHFLKMEDQKQDSRVMVFAQYRGSASELVRQLKRHEPIVKPTIFVGQQADARGGAGMKQKEQIEVHLLKFINLGDSKV